jgi:23S rRNA (adenine2030-N6)-methyltransferase
MNYRHRFHAGNFGDVMKHVVLMRLVAALQRKPKGFLYLDTHAGRGSYDLAAAATGDSLARTPEWPDGIGRLWSRTDLPPALAEYVTLVRDFDRRQGNVTDAVRFYPGSPWIVRLLARADERLLFCEKHPEEFAALRAEFAPGAYPPGAGRITVQETDGYVALRAALPPPQRRALVLIDPPYEAADEVSQVTAALAEGLRRFPNGVFAIWYPLTARARVDEFYADVCALKPPPTFVAELTLAGEQAALRMRGCGLCIVNPPWQMDTEVEPLLSILADLLAQAPGAAARVQWLVRER